MRRRYLAKWSGALTRGSNQEIELEADPRHATVVVRKLGLVDAKLSIVPGARVRDEAADDSKDETEPYSDEREPDEARQYRATVARWNYLAVD